MCIKSLTNLNKLYCDYCPGGVIVHQNFWEALRDLAMYTMIVMIATYPSPSGSSLETFSIGPVHANSVIHIYVINVEKAVHTIRTMEVSRIWDLVGAQFNFSDKKTEMVVSYVYTCMVHMAMGS